MAIHLVYFESPSGEILLPPTSDTPTPRGCIRKEANFINEVLALEKRLEQQTRDRDERQAEAQQAMMEPVRVRVRRNIMSAIASADTDAYTKDFLRHWCMCVDEKRAKYTASYRAREVYLEALNYDRPQTLIDVTHGKVSD